MASAIQASAKEAILSGALDLITAVIKVQLVDAADYTYSAAHNFMDDVPAGAKVGSASPALTGKTATGGVFDAADVIIPGVSGDPVENAILFEDTGSSATDRYICFIDAFASGMPLTPTGAGVQIAWHASGIFQWA